MTQVDTTRMREIVARVEKAFDAGTLTKTDFDAAWHELEQVLGDGPEAEGLEALTLYAEPEWVDELTAAS